VVEPNYVESVVLDPLDEFELFLGIDRSGTVSGGFGDVLRLVGLPTTTLALRPSVPWVPARTPQISPSPPPYARYTMSS